MIPHANTATRQGLQTLFIARSGEGNTLDIFVCMPATRMAELGKLRTNAGLRGAAEDGQEVYISGHKRAIVCTTLFCTNANCCEMSCTQRAAVGRC